VTGQQGENVASAPGSDLLGEPFRLDSISDVPAPEGGEGVWQQYVIVQGANTIIGLRAGTRSEVTLQVEGMVERLNERFRKGKAPLAEGPGRKPSFRPGRPSGSRSHTPRPP
jgi:hypothetical protein